jgi:hypothetical protein
MVIIHDLGTEEVTVVANAEQARSKTDKSGVATAMRMKDVITMGKTIYEFSPQLERFAKTWGRRWKSILRDAWNTGGYPHSTLRDDIPYLQRLRSKLGGSL